MGAGNTGFDCVGLCALTCMAAVGWGGGAEGAVSAWGCKLATVALNTAAVADAFWTYEGAGATLMVTG
jgi:hypothetical protein